jgi:hypothetical protein
VRRASARGQKGGPETLANGMPVVPCKASTEIGAPGCRRTPRVLQGVPLDRQVSPSGQHKSRFRGVSYDKKKRKWRVQIKVGCRIFLCHSRKAARKLKLLF